MKAGLIVAAAILVIGLMSVYVVQEPQQVIIT